METAIAPPFGDLLRCHRLAAGLTQEALAERAGMSVRAITDLERGARRAPYRDTVRQLAGALVLDDASRERFEEAARRPRERTVPVPSGGRGGDLPVPLTPLLGREREVAAAAAMVRRTDGRLLTLVGPGGVGKTRVALEVAAAVRQDFADGVVFVALGSLDDPAYALPAIAQALGVAEVPGRSWSERLAEALRDRHLLLVLDNLEHLLPATPSIAALLQRCPRLTVLATSRASLHLSGEREVPVQPLATPGDDERSVGEDLGAYASVQLYCERAAAVWPTFALTPANAASVAAIVERLDGLPLAIELAAARSRVLPPEALLARLERRLPLLTGGARDLPARQRTLRDTIAWSYDLLTADEQALFRRLSVFAGSCTLEAAAAVCSEQGTGNREQDGTTETVPCSLFPVRSDVLDGIGTLIDKSLLRQEVLADGEPSFSMLATIQEFAREQVAADDWETLCERHAAYFLALAEREAPALESARRGEALVRLVAQQDNFRAALRWSLAYGEGVSGARIAGALSYVWERRGWYSEGRRWLGEALATPGGGGRSPVRARLLLGAGLLAYRQSDYPAAPRLLEECAAIARDAGDRRTLAAALGWLAVASSEQRDGNTARRWADESVALCRDLGDRWLLARALNIAGSVAVRVGEIERAVRPLEESAALWEGLGDIGSAAIPINNLAGIHYRAGHYDRARAVLDRTLPHLRASGDRRNVAVALEWLGWTARAQGDLALSERSAREALALYRELGIRLLVLAALQLFAALCLDHGLSRRAARLIAAIEAEVERIGGWTAFMQQQFERDRAAARAALGDGAFRRATEEGRVMGPDEAAALALEAIAGPEADDALSA